MAKPLEKAAAETIVATSVTVRGELEATGDILVDGEVTGNITSKGDVSVGRTGTVQGDITATNVSLSGQVHGLVKTHEHFELRYSGRLIGDIHCRTIEIATGGYLKGQIQMADPEKQPKGEQPAAE